MKFTQLQIPDVIMIEPKIHTDSRGAFYEGYQKDLFVKNGIDIEFVQDNYSISSKGVIRGLHYQLEPRAQAKLIRVVSGEIFDVVVDVRKNSKYFGQHIDIELSASNRKMLYVPAGFAHGFCALTDQTEVSYKVSDYYAPECERGVKWNDPALAIRWPDLGKQYIFSDKDQKYPTLQKADCFR